MSDFFRTDRKVEEKRYGAAFTQQAGNPGGSRRLYSIHDKDRASTIQRKLVRARQGLDLTLALQRRGLIGAGFLVNQSDRRTSARVFGTFARVMGGEALGQVVGDAAIEGVVGALEEVAGPGAFSW